MNLPPISRVRPILPIFVFILAVLVLVGWAFDLDPLKRGLASSVAMNPTTAVCLILIALETTRLNRKPTNQFYAKIGQLAIIVVVAISVSKLSDIIFGSSFLIDQHLFSTRLNAEEYHPSRMAPNTALCILLLGCAMQIVRNKAQASVFRAQLLALVAFLLALLAFIGQLFNAQALSAVAKFIPMAVNTSFSILLISVSILFTYPRQGFMRVFAARDSYSSNIIVSALLPASILIPVMFGWLSLEGERSGVYNMSFALAFAATMNVLALLFLSFFSAQKIFAFDIERKQTETELRIAAKAFETDEGIMITDQTGRIIKVNKAFTIITGYGPGEVIGQTPAILSSGKHDAEFFRKMWASLIRDKCWRGEVWNRRKDGVIYLEFQNITAVSAPDGGVTHYVAVLSDITKQRDAEEKTRFLAYHDQMTTLPNRELFFDRLSQAISQARRNQQRLALLYLDLDGFKAINDKYGHEAGDSVLKSTATRLLTCLRNVDTVARLGGDEFAVILCELEKQEDATGVAQKITQKLAEPMRLLNGNNCEVGVSIGIAIYPEDGVEIDSLMNAADTAMYESKSTGKGTYTFFSKLASGVANTQPWIAVEASQILGVKEMDQQHFELAELLNQLNMAVHFSESSEIVNQLFNDLIGKIHLHFEAEERLMNAYQYGNDAHKQEHQRLILEVGSLKEKFIKGGSEALVLQSLKGWLVNHIQYTDKELANFLILNGIK